ncbi:unnamed protein product [Victoria cruziana]
MEALWATRNGERRPEKVIFGKYELGRLLGHGAFAKVYHAREMNSGKSVAIKVMNKSKIVSGGFVSHIKREISIMRRLRHPNIVRPFEVLASKTKIYFVMELVKGGPLFDKLAMGRLKEDVARRYFQQLISAVRVCHSRGVFHRDLKPENLLLDEADNIKVSDFGLSAVSEQVRHDGLFHTLCGTPAYVAPEVLANKGYDARKVDIWSCGVILFVMVAGYLPFNDRNLMNMYRKIYKGEFSCPRWMSSELRWLVHRLLETDTERRITIDEIIRDPWFRKGGYEEVKLCSSDDGDDDGKCWWRCLEGTCSESPLSSRTAFSPSSPLPTSSSCGSAKEKDELPTLNAFDIISFSRGMNLSGLFEGSEFQSVNRFISGEPMSTIVEKLEEVAKTAGFTVRKKHFRAVLEGGSHGQLVVVAEMFRLTGSLMLVEIKKKNGDAHAYEDFWERKLRPALRDLAFEPLPAFPNSV